MVRPDEKEIRALYEAVRRLHERTHVLLASVQENYDAKLWQEIRDNDRHVAELWDKIKEIEKLWRLH